MNMAEPVTFPFILGTVGAIVAVIAVGIFLVKQGAARRRS